jgi:cell division protein FtsI/penicillin-binding protein 2
MSKEIIWRYNVVALGFVAVAALVIFQISRLQFSGQKDEFTKEGDLYKRTLHTYYPARGQIYDRWGRLLAGNIQAYEVGANVYAVENPEFIAMILSKVLVQNPQFGRPDYYDQVKSNLAFARENNISYITLANSITAQELAELQEIANRYAEIPPLKNDPNPQSLSGLVYRPRMQRFYPEKDLAGNILGFVNRDGQGVFGIEEKFNDLLLGEPQSVMMTLDPYLAGELPEPDQGVSLILTIDREIQAFVEEVLDNALVESGAQSGTIIVLDPETGEVLAMATTPHLDLNEYWNYPTIFTGDTPFNRATSLDYEPGSVFKVITMASALDQGAVKPDTIFVDPGVIEIGGIFIHNWNYGAWGPQDMQGCMQHSLNVCLTWVATQLGATNFYTYLQNFGFGRLTGVEVAAEVPGRVKIPGDTDWYEADLGTNSFGQGIAVTPIQMAMAVSAIAHDGKMMVPHLMRAMLRDGRQYTPAPTMVGMPISTEVARTLTELLARSLENESSDALITGYRVAGKTGTAEIPGPGGYTTNLTNASFVGWGPADDAKFLVYVWLEKPTTSPWGSVVAAPVFREVVERLVVLMDIPPDDIRIQMGSH